MSLRTIRQGDSSSGDVHLSRALELNVSNNILCGTPSDAALAKKLFKAPEFVRFQVSTVWSMAIDSLDCF